MLRSSALLSVVALVSACSLIPVGAGDRQPIASPNLLIKCSPYQSEMEQPVRVSDVYAEVRRLVSQHDECKTRHNHLVEQLESE